MRDFQPLLAEVAARLDVTSDVLKTDAQRLFHGRGQCFEGYQDLTVDRFGEQLLVSQFRNTEDDLQPLFDALREMLPDAQGLTLQRRQGRRTHSQVQWGSVPDRFVASEAGLQFWVELQRNQNVGLFLDMQPTRHWLREQCGYLEAPAVLNLFAFTCAFSVVAVAAGATKVVNNDMSKPALDWGKANHVLNTQDLRCVSMLGHNLFKSWWKLRKLAPFDVIIIDPPSNQQGSFNAEKQYGQILKRIPELAKPGAWVVACLNSPFLNEDFVPLQMSRWCPECELVQRLPNSPDFPDVSPDTALKVFLFRYRA
jgi:23S rRNA (cytosine1962-C5)-methyltransferase